MPNDFMSPTIKPTPLPRTCIHRIAPELNAAKRAALEAMHAEWQRTLPLAFDWYWRGFLQDGRFRDDLAVGGPKSVFPPTQLVTSQKGLMVRAIAGQAASWTSNLRQRIRRAIMDAVADDGLQHELLWINAMMAWLLPFPEQLTLLSTQAGRQNRLLNLSPAASRIMRNMVRSYLGRKRLPDPANLPLQVNVNSAVLAPAVRSRSPWARSWLRVSTLERGRRIELPVMGNLYADRFPGKVAQTFSLVRDSDGGWFLHKTQYREAQPWAEHRTDRLAIDLGLRNLMSTNHGDILGSGFINRLSRYDRQLLALQRGLQGAGECRLNRCRRYQRLVQQLRGFLKTTIQTGLKRLLDLHRPQVVIVERLLFAGQPGQLSKRMNRLLRRFGQRYFTNTLHELQAFHGFTVEEVDPAYTSQTCNRCRFTHRANRDRNRFTCLACGHVAHADVNAAKNLHGRSVQEPADRQPMAGRTGWTKALAVWIAALKRSIGETSPCLSRQYRAVGSARMGLKKILGRNDSASRLSSTVKRQMQVCCLASPEGLSAELTNLACLLRQASRCSTR